MDSYFREWWASAPQLDENSLRDGILELLHKIHDANADDDWHAIRQYIKLYELGETYCREEPHLSLYEYGSMGIGCTIAANHLNHGEYAKVADKVKEVIDRYTARMERYRLQNLPPRRASEIKYHYLLILCDLKWIAPETWRDTLLTPDEVLDELRATVEHIFDFIAANPKTVRNERNLREGLALAELASCKMALRYCPERLPELVSHLNASYDQDLALADYDYQQLQPESNKSAYYWDFELAKLRMTPDPPLQDIYMCIELRSLAARYTFGDWKIQGLLRGWRRETLSIIREIQSRPALPQLAEATAG